jgi:hypothetical protein
MFISKSSVMKRLSMLVFVRGNFTKSLRTFEADELKLL